MLVLNIPKANGTHIVGGEMIYSCLGGNSYEVRLRLYRDCTPGNANFGTGTLYVFTGTGASYTTVSAPPAITSVPITIDNPCLSPPPGLCLEQGDYVFTVNLPPNSSGYDLMFSSCCRNGTIVNLTNPLSQGSTYWQPIPPSNIAQCNSSPIFINFPPVVICLNEPLNFNHAAFDPEGDSLVYSLCTPYESNTGAPPYTQVGYAPGFNGSYPITANPAFAIHPSTGLLTGTPTAVGQYVVGVCVSEYRNGVFLGAHFRDFQFNVVQCIPTVLASTPDVQLCKAGLTVNFVNNGYGPQFLWDFGDPLAPNDTSTLFSPSYTYPDTGTYIVTLIADPNDTCADTAHATVSLYDPFVTTTFTHAQPCFGLPMPFMGQTVLSVGSVSSWQWNFGDGGTGTGSTPLHTYAGTGPYTVTMIVTTNAGCKDTFSQAVTLNPTPAAGFLITPDCIGLPFQFTDVSTLTSGNIVAWNWNFGDGNSSPLQNPSHTYAAAGSFMVKLVVTTDQGCRDSVTHLAVVYPTIADAGPDVSICDGGSTQLSGSGGGTYLWSPAITLSNPTIASPVASPVLTTTYSMLVSDAYGCQDSDQVIVFVNPNPVANAGPDVGGICPGDTTTLNASGGLSYQWIPATGLSDPTASSTGAAPTSTTVYTVTVTDANGCTDSDAVVVVVFPEPAADAGIDVGFCTGYSVQLAASGGVTYLWSPASGLSSTTVSNPVASPATTTIYQLTITDANGCTDDDAIEVTVFPAAIADAGSDQTIFAGETTALAGTGNGSYLWSPASHLLDPSSAITPAYPMQTTIYTLLVTTVDGCTATDSMTLFVKDVGSFVVPTAFSPNADGVNDVFRIELTEGITLTRFVVFNRWGEIAFETADLTAGWDGITNGRLQPIGSYAFRIEGTTPGGQVVEQAGNVTLLR
jgi:gliding motility-associated-like protein